MSKKQFILMGDVVSSSEYNAEELREGLKQIVDLCNQQFKSDILSPLTITLGDEFQGVVKSAHAGVSILFFLEEASLKIAPFFKLHFVLHHGLIDTKINPDIAYEMMGSGLTEARQLLSDKKRGRARFKFALQDDHSSTQLGRLFEVLDTIILNWKKDDYPLILDMIQNANNKEVGELHDKNRDQIWKRRKTLMIEEYNHLKTFILNYV